MADTLRQRKSTVPHSFQERLSPKSLPRRSNNKISIFMLIVGAILIIIMYFLITRLGFGSYFPVQEFSSASPLLDKSVVEIVAELDAPPGNLAISSKGRIFFNFHPEYSPHPTKIAELVNKTSWVAFPDNAFQSRIQTCLSMRIDSKNRLWLLDFGMYGFKSEAKLFAFDVSVLPSQESTLLLEYSFPTAIAGMGSMLNDFQVDPSGEYIYLVDTSIVASTPAIIVFQIQKQTSHRLFSGHAALYGNSHFFRIGSYSQIKYGPFGLKINVDSVVLDRDGSNLYFGALTSNRLYRISTSHLLFYVEQCNVLGPREAEVRYGGALQEQITLVSSDKPMTDGLSSDLAGNIWMTAVEHSALVIATRAKKGSTSSLSSSSSSNGMFGSRQLQSVLVVQDEQLLRWPDGLCFGPDGLYITNSMLHMKLGRIAPTATGTATGTPRQTHNHTESVDLLGSYGPFHILRISAEHLKTIAGDIMPAAGH